MKGRVLVVVVILSALQVGCTREDTASIDRRSPVFLNEDCTNFLLVHYRGKVPVTRESIRGYAAKYLKGPVTHYVVNASGGLVAPFDSKTADCKWHLHDRLKCTCEGFSRFWVETLRQLNAEGIDPYAELMAAAREKGIIPWVSIRMNDVHSVIEVDQCGNSDLWRNHPEYRREPGRPVKRGVGRWHYALDYAHQEVREAFLRAIVEVVARYDADGVELDFTRHQFYFQPRREREDAHFLTEFMREVRRIVARADKSLIVRVPTTLQVCRAYGMDVDDWMREGLVDVVVPANLLDMADYDLPVDEWLELAQAAPRPVRVVPGCDAFVTLERKNEGSRHITTAEEYRGWMDLVFARGGTGLYFFNHFIIERQGPTARHDVGLGENPKGLDPDAVRARSRAYPVSHRDYIQLEGAGFNMSGCQLPLSLDQTRKVVVHVGKVGPAVSCVVRLGTDRALALEQQRGIQLNGIAPLSVDAEDPKRWLGNSCDSKAVVAVAFPISAVKDGRNEVRLPEIGSDAKLLAAEMFLYGEE